MNQIIDEAVKILKNGEVVVYPTDTSYGLAVDATSARAVKKLYRLKGRDFKKPIHVIFPSQASMRIFGRISLWAKKLMKKFWPGPLTIVLPLKARGKSWQMLSAGTKTLGVRMPRNKIALKLVKKFGKPITTTSANLAGGPNCYSVAEVKKQLEPRLRLLRRSKTSSQWVYYLDGGKLKKTKPSTVLSLIGRVRIIRQGPISEKQINEALE